MSDLLSYKNYNGTVEYSREDNYGSSIVRKTKKIRLKENRVIKVLEGLSIYFRVCR